MRSIIGKYKWQIGGIVLLIMMSVYAYANRDIVMSDKQRADLLRNAVERNDYREVDKLVNKHPQLINQPNSRGGVAVGYTIFPVNEKMMDHLLALGADINQPSYHSQYGNTPLGKHSLLIRAIAQIDFKIVEILLKRGANPNLLDESYQWTPLTMALGIRSEVDANRMIGLLISYKADVNSHITPCSPLFYADNKSTREYLKKHGARVRADEIETYMSLDKEYQP